MRPERRRRWARYLLALVRLVNGTVGLFAPQLLITRFDPDRDPSPAAIYAFRLFGIRTILIAADLLRPGHAQKAAREGVLIHASDVITAASLGLGGAVPRRTAVATTLISVVNVILALLAREPRPDTEPAADPAPAAVDAR
jgi:voltage-gated potassium channel Kch